MRLQKYLAHAGIASRRAAERIIATGSVTVEGTVVTDPARDVSEEDDVRVDGRPVHPVEEPVHILLYKPVGMVTTVHDPEGRPCVMDLVPDLGRRLYPVGRLDFDTSGLLILTDDGAFAHRMTHPSSELVKTYDALVLGVPGPEALRSLREGVGLEGRPTAPAGVRILSEQGGGCVVEVRIHEGRNRQVRRMLEAVGHPVLELCRTGYGPLRIEGLAPGQSRLLRPEEIDALLASTRSAGRP